MTEQQMALARRAVACKGWRWMPGMLAWRPDCPPLRLATDEVTEIALQDHGWLPDLIDPATLGCLLALVREAHGDPHAYLAPGDGWFVGRRARDGIVGEGDTEAEALVAALEAAP